MKFPSPLDLLFPPRCVICRALVEHDTAICPDCARALQTAAGQVTQQGDFFRICYSPLLYAEPLRASFLRYKFSGASHYARTYGEWMAECYARLGGEERPDLVTWAPLSRRRKRRRGYDQAELLAREVASRIDLPVVPTLKKAHRAPLSGLAGEKSLRSAKIHGAYSLRNGIDLAGRRILLVDDIITTGSTLNECARILRAGGAADVMCLTLARRAERNGNRHPSADQT